MPEYQIDVNDDEKRFWNRSRCSKVWTVSKRQRNGLQNSGCSVRPETSAVGGGRWFLFRRKRSEYAPFFMSPLQKLCKIRQNTSDGSLDERNDLSLPESGLWPHLRLHGRSVKNAFPIRHSRSRHPDSYVTASPSTQTGHTIRRRS